MREASLKTKQNGPALASQAFQVCEIRLLASQPFIRFLIQHLTSLHFNTSAEMYNLVYKLYNLLNLFTVQYTSKLKVEKVPLLLVTGGSMKPSQQLPCWFLPVPDSMVPDAPAFLAGHRHSLALQVRNLF